MRIFKILTILMLPLAMAHAAITTVNVGITAETGPFEENDPVSIVKIAEIDVDELTIGSQDVQLRFSVGGTAIKGTDYELFIEESDGTNVAYTESPANSGIFVTDNTYTVAIEKIFNVYIQVDGAYDDNEAEGPETIEISMLTNGYSVVSDSLNIDLEDEEPSFTLRFDTLGEPKEGSADGTLILEWLDAPSAGVWFDVNVSDTSAIIDDTVVADPDYDIEASGTNTFVHQSGSTWRYTANDGSTLSNLNIDVINHDDGIIEGLENVSITYNVDGETVVRFAIGDNEPIISVTASQDAIEADGPNPDATQEAEETDGYVTISLDWTGASTGSKTLPLAIELYDGVSNGLDYDVEFQLNAGARSGVGMSDAGGTITVDETITSVTAYIDPTGDSVFEAQSTISVAFNQTGTTHAEILLRDDEFQSNNDTFAIEAVIPKFRENDTTGGVFAVTRNSAIGIADVQIDFSGAAIDDGDITRHVDLDDDLSTTTDIAPLINRLRFLDGDAVKYIRIKAANDNIVESGKMVTAKIVDLIDYDIDQARESASIIVQDDDNTPTITLTGGAAETVINEDGVSYGEFTIQFDDFVDSAWVSFLGTAMHMPDAQGPVDYAIFVQDNYTTGGQWRIIYDAIFDGTSRRFEIQPDATTNAARIRVYAVTTIENYPSDSDSATRSLYPPRMPDDTGVYGSYEIDEEAEGSETIICRLLDSDDYLIDINNAATAIIEDDDLVISAEKIQDAGEPSFSGGFRITTRDGITPVNDIPISYTILPTSTATPGQEGDVGADYQLLTGIATLKAGNSSVSIEVKPFADNVPENAETVILQVNDTYDYVADTLPTATVKIADIVGNVTISGPSSAVEEGQIGTITVTLDRSASNGDTSAVPIYLRIDSNSTATTADYNEPDQLIIEIQEGASTGTLNFTTISDQFYEGNETITVQVVPAPKYQLAPGSSGSATITIDDLAPVISLAQNSATVIEGDSTTITVTATASMDLIEDVAFEIVSSSSSTASTDDFTVTLGAITEDNGVFSGELTIDAIDDGLDEGDETFSLRLVPTEKGSAAYGVNENVNEAEITIQDPPDAPDGSGELSFISEVDTVVLTAGDTVNSTLRAIVPTGTTASMLQATITDRDGGTGPTWATVSVSAVNSGVAQIVLTLAPDVALAEGHYHILLTLRADLNQNSVFTDATDRSDSQLILYYVAAAPVSGS